MEEENRYEQLSCAFELMLVSAVALYCVCIELMLVSAVAQMRMDDANVCVGGGDGPRRGVL